MTKFVSVITGLFISFSLVSATEAAWHVTDYDTASGNGSLAERYTSGKLESRIVEVSTFEKVFNPSYYDLNHRSMRQYVNALRCVYGDVAACVTQAAR